MRFATIPSERARHGNGRLAVCGNVHIEKKAFDRTQLQPTRKKRFHLLKNTIALSGPTTDRDIL